MTSILHNPDSNLSRRKSLTAQESAVKDHSILNINILTDLANEVIAEHMLPAEKKGEAIKGKYRTRDRIERSTVRDLLGKVDEKIWRAMVGAALSSMKKNIEASQGNGQWAVLEAEIEVANSRAGVQEIMIGVRWTDTLNQEDLQYANGQPALNVNVRSTISQEVIDAIKEGNQGSDPDMKALLKALAKKALEDDQD